MPDTRRLNLVLAGIGLVLVGLLAGILFMLVVQPRAADPPAPEVVDAVRLGSQDPPLRTTDVDSTLQASAMPQPAALNRLFREVAERVTPAVVFIQVRTEAPEMPEDGYHEFEGDMRDFFRSPMPRQSVGSGVLVSEDGYIVTNQHVVERAERIQVTLSDKRQFSAEVVGTDASTDLAVLQVESDEALPAVRLGNSEEVGVGDWVVAIGNPFRLTSTVTAGIVSALGRQVNIIEDAFRIEDFIQTDAAINPGNSGGALVNLRGELVGINTAIATESGSYEGYGFAVPSNLMERVVGDLIAYGEVRRGFMGVSIQEIDAARADALGLASIHGVFIDAVRSDGAADQAGIQSGDVVLSIENERVNAPNELQSVVARHRPGDTLEVVVWRDGNERNLPVRLMGRNAPAYQGWTSRDDAEGPEPRNDAPAPRDGGDASDVEALEDWGLGLRPLGPPDRRAFGVQDGVFVAFVESEGRAAAAGLPRGVVLTHVNDTPVTSIDAVRTALSANTSSHLLQVRRRDGTTAFYEID